VAPHLRAEKKLFFVDNRTGRFLGVPYDWRRPTIFGMGQRESVTSRIRSNGTSACSAARRTACSVPSNTQRTTSSSRMRIEPR